MTVKEQAIASPCTRRCCLDSQDICVGCYRSLDDILAWGSENDEGKQAILDKAQYRKVESFQQRK